MLIIVMFVNLMCIAARAVFGVSVLIVLALTPCVAQEQLDPAPMLNQLKGNASPYLAIHGDDPVAWQTWSPATIELARKQNKLLFVSIGYFSCHWCHVMQSESYRNLEIADYINQNFVPVKVDRELEVALDAEMIAYVLSLHGAAGWPLNAFITPDGNPLYATLYDKPERFLTLLMTLGQEWWKDTAGLRALAQSRVKAPKKLHKMPLNAALANSYRMQLVSQTLAKADLLEGGLNLPSKFPIAPQLEALLEIVSVHQNSELSQWLRLTLDKMAQGGLRDHVAGGFFRYTVDPAWHTPHFEKMLYDNAQLAKIYLRAAKIFKHAPYREIAFETLDFMLDEMRYGHAFITSTSALDDHGNEGGVYLWGESQLKAILEPEDYLLLHKIWDMQRPSEFNLGYLPMNRQLPTLTEQSRLKKIYAALKQQRQLRGLPKDTKLLTSLNGLALVALSEAADFSPRYLLAATELRAVLINELWKNGKLSKGLSNQQSLGSGDFESYAYATDGLLHFAQLKGQSADLKLVQKMSLSAWRQFHTPYGFQLDQGSDFVKQSFKSVMEDGPLPSPSSLLIKVSLSSGSKALRNLARDALAEAVLLDHKNLFWFSTQVSALNLLYQRGGVRY
jgi:uncharacterized protein